MGIFNIFSRKEPVTEKRAITRDTAPWLFASPPAAGIPVTTRSALSIPAVYAAVSGVADTISTLPLPVFKRGDQGGEKDYRHPVYDLLAKAPNPVQTAKAYRASQVVDLLAHGEHFSEIVRDGAGRPVELWRVDPSQVRTEWDRTGRRLRYWFGSEEFDATHLLHVVGFSTDGFRGVSPFALCQDSLSLTLALDKYGSSFFRNGARPGGVMLRPPGLSVEDKEDAKQSWQEAHSGADNAGKTAFLPDGFKFDKQSLAPEEGQFHESRTMQLRECQRITRTPPHLSNDFERQTWNNYQWARLDFVQNTIRPLVVALEQEMNRKLLFPGEQSTHYVEHVLEGLLRGSANEQMDYAIKACGGPVLTPDEGRRFLGYPTTEGGDKLRKSTEPAPAPANGVSTDPTTKEANGQ